MIGCAALWPGRLVFICVYVYNFNEVMKRKKSKGPNFHVFVLCSFTHFALTKHGPMFNACLNLWF